MCRAARLPYLQIPLLPVVRCSTAPEVAISGYPVVLTTTVAVPLSIPSLPPQCPAIGYPWPLAGLHGDRLVVSPLGSRGPQLQ